MAWITTLSDLRTYIKQELGNPVVNVEVDDLQINQSVEKAIQVMNKYNYGEGTFLDYAVFTTTAGQAYYELGTDLLTTAFADIQDVIDFNISFGAGGINTLFTPTHILLQEMNGAGGQFGTSPNWAGYSTPGLELASYQIAMMYIQEIHEMLGKMYTVNWLPGRRVLHITPTPTQALTGVLQVYRRETAENLYNNILVKNLATAYVKQQWGSNLRKHQMTLPGGGSNAGNEIRQEAAEEIKDAIESIRFESNPIDFFVG